MTNLCLQQPTMKGFDPRAFPPPSIGKFINLHVLSTSYYLLWIGDPDALIYQTWITSIAMVESPAPGIWIREPSVRRLLAPVPVPISWQPEVGYFLSPYKTTLIGISFKKSECLLP
jgi:hypothetical protein